MLNRDNYDLSNVVVVHNHKGGTFKTSLVSNIAGLLAVSGDKVLVVDLDPQGNVAIDLGYTDHSDSGQALLASLLTGKPLSGDALLEVRPNLVVAPGGPALKRFRPDGDPAAAFDALVPILGPLTDDYSLILLDTPPSQDSPLVHAALGAAQHLLLPTKADQASLDGIRMITESLEDAHQHNPDLALLGIILTGVGASSHRIHSAAADHIDTLVGRSFLFQQVLRHVEAAAIAQRERGMTIRELVVDNPEKFAALRSGQRSLGESANRLEQEYLIITQELINRLNQAWTDSEDDADV